MRKVAIWNDARDIAILKLAKAEYARLPRAREKINDLQANPGGRGFPNPHFL